MKIVNFISSCGIGGAEILVRNVVLEINKQYPKIQQEVWIGSRVEELYKDETLEIRIQNEKEFVKNLEENGIAVKFINRRPNKDILKTLKQLRKFYKKFKPDIIHTHSETLTAYLIIALLDKKIKIVETIHNEKVNFPKLMKIFLNLKLKRIISLTGTVTHNLLKLGIKNKKIIEIENAINIEKFEVKNREFEKSKLKMIAVGRIEPQKNYSSMVKIYEELILICKKNNVITPELIIVGDGIEREKIEVMINNKNLDKNIKLLGIRKDIPELLKKSDIYLMSSSWEGFPIALIEATASGLPIVSTNVGSNYLVVEENENGFLVNCEEEEKFAKKIFELIIDIEKREKFSNKSKELSKKYELSNIIKKWFNLYESL